MRINCDWGMTYVINAFGHVFCGRCNLFVNRLVGDIYSALAALAYEGSNILGLGFEWIRVARLDNIYRLVCNDIGPLNKRSKPNLEWFGVPVCGGREALGGVIRLSRENMRRQGAIDSLQPRADKGYGRHPPENGKVRDFVRRRMCFCRHDREEESTNDASTNAARLYCAVSHVIIAAVVAARDAFSFFGTGESPPVRNLRFMPLSLLRRPVNWLARKSVSVLSATRDTPTPLPIML